MSNKTYGGKLGVWLGKKRNVNVNNRNRQKARNMMHTLLPATLFRSRGPSLRGSDLGQIKAKSKPADVGRSKISWDEVRCRPIYFGTDDSAIDNDETKNISDIGYEDSTKFQDLSIDSEKQKSLHQRPQDDNSERNSFWNDSKGSRGKNGKRYGTQKEKRLDRISNMTSAVMEQCASPLWERRHYGKQKRSGITKRKSFVATEASRITKPCDTTSFPMSTPPSPSSHVVSTGRSVAKSLSSLPNENDNFGAEEDNLSFIKHTSTEKYTAQRNHLRKRKILVGKKTTITKLPKKRVDNVKSRDENNDILEKNGDGTKCCMLRQPTSSTSLTNARAYFQYLDATQELNIDPS